MTAEQIHKTAVHEAGHYLGCAHFSMRAWPEVAPQGFYSPSSSFAGECRIPDPLSRYQACVVGWMGALAQCVAGVPDHWMPNFKVTKTTLRDWHLMVLARLDKLSDEDGKMIRGGQGKIWMACKCAFRILTRNRVRLRHIAKYLAADAEKRQANEFSLTMNPIIPKLPPSDPLTDNFQSPDAQLELPNRAQVLKNFLARMTPDDPQRPKFQKMLECLERGEKLPDEA